MFLLLKLPKTRSLYYRPTQMRKWRQQKTCFGQSMNLWPFKKENLMSKAGSANRLWNGNWVGNGWRVRKHGVIWKCWVVGRLRPGKTQWPCNKNPYTGQVTQFQLSISSHSTSTADRFLKGIATGLKTEESKTKSLGCLALLVGYVNLGPQSESHSLPYLEYLTSFNWFTFSTILSH